MRDRLGVASPLVRSHSGGVSAASLGGMLPLLVARLGKAILGMVAPSLDLKIDQNGALPLSRSVYYSWIWEKIFEDRLPAAVPRLRCEEY